jgi:hypothetical protein
MIELLLQAERSLSVGLVDQAERMYLQAIAADPHNSIAVVGLARVALERGDDVEAWRRAREALAIDRENVAAQRLAARLDEVYAFRGESIAGLAEAREPDRGNHADPGPGAVPGSHAPAQPTTAPADTSSPIAHPTPAAPLPNELGRLDRLFRRKRQ